MSVQSVPVPMATSATSKHRLCKWAGGSETLPSPGWGQRNTAGEEINQVHF